MTHMTNGNTGTMGTMGTMGNKADGLADQLKGLVGAGQERMIDVKDKILDVKDIVVEKADSTATLLGRTIKTNPFIAVGVAFGIGYVAMRLFRR